MSSHIGPHGFCPFCNGSKVKAYNCLDCPTKSIGCKHCHGSGCACPGGPVRTAVYTDDGKFCGLLWICQTCHGIVDPAEVTHG